MNIDNLVFNLYKRLKYKNKFSIKDKIFFFRELAYLLEGGIGTVEALTLIRNNTNNSIIKYICDYLYERLKRGETFSRTLTRLPKYFNEGDVNIIKGGENSGELVSVLKYLSGEYEFLNNLRNRYISALVYPATIFLVALVAIFVLFKFILPGIISIIEQFEVENLPFTTWFLINIVNFFQHYILHIVIILFFIIFGFSLVLSVDEGKKWFDKKKLKLPIIGKIIKYYLLVKFLRYLKLFMFAGIAYTDMFYSLKSIMKNSIYKDMIDDILDNINQGHSVSEIFGKYTIIIPEDVVVLSKVGEETASIGESMGTAISLYEDDFNKTLDSISKVIEPILVVFVGGLVAFIALSVFGIIGVILDSIQGV